MIFTASDVESLSRSLRWWEMGEYASAALVTIACAGEYAADFADWITGGVKERKEKLAKRSTMLLIAALSLELICLVRTNQLSGSVIGSLGDKAEEADKKARVAITDSSTALSQAKDALAKGGAAQDSLGKAEDEANKAQAAASSALSLARGARQEAHSFERDIVSAKEQATKAESHLAEALKRAAEATAELDRIKSPRSVLNESNVISTLAAFKGTGYAFTSLGEDEESSKLLGQIDSILQRAGWQRMPLPYATFPAINLSVNGAEFQVAPALTTGIGISVDSSETTSTLQSLPRNKLPKPVGAAVALRMALFSNLSPPQAEMQVSIEAPGKAPGTFPWMGIRIAVGKKRLQ